MLHMRVIELRGQSSQRQSTKAQTQVTQRNVVVILQEQQIQNDSRKPGRDDVTTNFRSPRLRSSHSRKLLRSCSSSIGRAIPCRRRARLC